MIKLKYRCIWHKSASIMYQIKVIFLCTNNGLGLMSYACFPYSRKPMAAETAIK